MPALAVNSGRLQRQIDELAALSEAPPPAVTRVLFSDADLRGRAYVKDRCREFGLVIREDAVGNLFARWEGSEPTLPALATGSHTDAIPNAGRYDGVVGVLGALEAFRALRESGFHPRRSLELIMFTAEEPTRFGLGCLGSRLLAGALTPAQAAGLRDPAAQDLEFWRARGGCEGSLESVRLAKGCYAGFLELHIEQGPILERENIPIGVVEKIAAPSSLRLELNGVGGHAGAVLMPERHDALLAGAEIALAVEEAAKSSGSPDTVATTGVFRIEPGAVNSVPCRAALEVDLRDTNVSTRDGALERIERAVAEICRRRGVTFKLDRVNVDAPAVCDPRLVECVVRVCGELRLPVKRLISRAYHDSLFMAQVCPVTMIFVPSLHGYSHRPDEYTSPEQIANGVRVLAHSLSALS